MCVRKDDGCAFKDIIEPHRPIDFSGRTATCSEDELKAFVKDRLAPFKYPRAIEFVKDLLALRKEAGPDAIMTIRSGTLRLTRPAPPAATASPS